MKANIHTKKIVAYGLILSFFYEKPILYIGGADRLFPRLFDLFFLIGLFVFASELLRPIKNPIYNSWKKIVFLFLLLAVTWSLLEFPFSIALYSLLFAIRYVQGLLGIKMLLLSGITLKDIGKWALYGLVFIAIYCIYELTHPIEGEYELYPGHFIRVPVGAIFGPLSPTYFHIAQLIPLAMILAYSYYANFKNQGQIFYLIIILLTIWPVFYSGSRTGLLLLLLTFALYLWLNIHNIKKYLWSILFVSVLLLFSWETLNKDSLTFQRLDELEETDSEHKSRDSFYARYKILERYSIRDYDYGSVIFVLGAGFDVAPINGKNRIDYGVHSMYLYPFEQAGLLGLIFFLYFLYKAFRILYERKKLPLCSAVFSYFIAMLIVGALGAHNFWRGFGTGNVNTFIVLCLCLSCVDDYGMLAHKTKSLQLMDDSDKA